MLNKSAEWLALERHYETIRNTHLRDLFAADPNRAAQFTIEDCGLYLDYAKHNITAQTPDLLLSLAHATKLEEKRDALFSGAKINNSENRAVLHTALRAPKNADIRVNGENIMPFIHDVLERMEKFSTSIRSGAHKGYSGKPISHIINIGIGGSDLGPKMAYEALDTNSKENISVRFVSNVDPADIHSALADATPETTLFVIASKTFTTQETMANAHAARQWFLEHAKEEKALARHFVALSTNETAVQAFGIAAENMFPFKEWVGGRFSVWSAIGLSIALRYGFATFRAFLDGAYAMDTHFRTAPLAQNMPVIMALLGIWYRNFWGYDSLAILPYSQNLQSFPRWLQQLDMESNGKSVDRDNNTLPYDTAPIIFGEPGTNGQHAFYQMLHQGTSIVPCDFIGIAHDDYQIGDQHNMLLANMLAQSKAMMDGKPESAQEMRHKNFDGNRPSSTLILERLDAYHLGALMALYEHKIFVQGVIWDINSFDQWGVELGKILATTILPHLDSEKIEKSAFDSSTEALLSYLHKSRSS